MVWFIFFYEKGDIEICDNFMLGIVVEVKGFYIRCVVLLIFFVFFSWFCVFEF